MVRPGSLHASFSSHYFIASGVMYAQQYNRISCWSSSRRVDGSGAPITDLKPEEIAMTENGAPGKCEPRAPQPSDQAHHCRRQRQGKPVALAAMREGLTGMVEALPADWR
jgi:hypothetical protein